MKIAEARTEVFVIAFKSLTRREQDAVLARLLGDQKISEDFMDALALENRRRQKRQDFRRTLKKLRIPE
jgi:hypothetical protein